MGGSTGDMERENERSLGIWPRIALLARISELVNFYVASLRRRAKAKRSEQSSRRSIDVEVGLYTED